MALTQEQVFQVRSVFPEAEFAYDTEGQLIIYTGVKLET